MNKTVILIMVLLLGGSMAYAQKEEVATMPSDSVQVAVMQNNLNKITWNTDPLSPAKAAFYSAVIPGLGQIYNKSYWKVPLVYAAIGTPIYFYIQNSKEYDRYLTAYKRRQQGYTDDEFYGNSSTGQPLLSTDGLRRGIQFYRRNKELSILIGIGMYALNVIEANVDAHLKQFNVDERLSLEPYIQTDYLTQPQFGLTLTYKTKK
ncbi:DUF5683 domain-containing protein [Capnocytophaga leadbetteri]|uniref:DUF5683 domain-containing protein n=1 Tax=Capnocytophaga leadbetteri TaxID=327575 RepID=UPI0028E5DBED|nr:DUF5683 domain-containing protein [Capnocytophaga leadbetteri]